MKVVILHQHFRTPVTGGAIRSYYLAKALVDHDIQTVVITAHNHRHYRKEVVDGIEVHYLPVPYDNKFGFYKRVYSFLRFVSKVVRFASHQTDADVVYAISTPLTTGLAARWIKRKHRIPYIFEVGDLWPEAPVQMGFIRNPIVKDVSYKMERVIYQGADTIIGLSEPIRDAIARKVSGKQLAVIPNMADMTYFQPEKKQALLEERFGVKEKFVVSYIGALGIANGLRHFLECAAAAQNASLPVHFLLCGDGAMKPELTSYAKSLGLGNLTIVPFQDRAGIRDIMNVTDANFISYLPLKVLETGSPNKYFDGLAAGKLTVVNFSGWIREEIEGEQCGIYIDAENPAAFVNAIANFVEDRTILGEFQQNARVLAGRKYSRKELGKQYAAIVMEVASAKNHT